MTTELVMYRGDDRDYEFTITEEGVAFDLTDYTVVFTAREDIDDEDAVFTLTTADGGVEIQTPQADPARPARSPSTSRPAPPSTWTAASRWSATSS